MKLRNLKQQIGLRSSVWNVMNSGHRNKRNKRFHLNLLKMERALDGGGAKRSKGSFHNIVRSQSLLNLKESQTDLHVTIHSTINVGVNAS